MLRCSAVSDPLDSTHQVPLSMRFSRQEYWNVLSFPSPGDLSNPGIELISLALADGFFTTEPPGKPPPTIKQPQTLECPPDFTRVCAKSLQLYLTLCNLMDCSPPGSSVHGILQARILEWVAMPSSRGSAQTRDRTCLSYVSCIDRWVLYH